MAANLTKLLKSHKLGDLKVRFRKMVLEKVTLNLNLKVYTEFKEKKSDIVIFS